MEQVYLDRFSEIDYELQTERLHEWCDLYHPVLVVAEHNAMGGPLTERLQTGYARLMGKPRAALPVWSWDATNASKAGLVQALGLAIERGDITLLDDQVQTSELLGYEARCCRVACCATARQVVSMTTPSLPLVWRISAPSAKPVPFRRARATGSWRVAAVARLDRAEQSEQQEDDEHGHDQAEPAVDVHELRLFRLTLGSTCGCGVGWLGWLD